MRWASTGHGRRIHDLRHTAACLWLARGVDPGTVQAWMGHESIATTNRYLHFLGTGADSAGLDRLNSRPGGTRGDASAGRANDNDETPPWFQRLRWWGGVLWWWSCGDSNPGPSHCEGVSGPIGHRCMRCMSCELTARAPRCRRWGAPGGHAMWCRLRGHPRLGGFSGCTSVRASRRLARSQVGKAGHRRVRALTFCSVGNPDFVQVVSSCADASVTCGNIPPVGAKSSRWSSRCRRVRNGSYRFPTESTPPRRLRVRLGTSLAWQRRP